MCKSKQAQKLLNANKQQSLGWIIPIPGELSHRADSGAMWGAGAPVATWNLRWLLFLIDPCAALDGGRVSISR